MLSIALGKRIRQYREAKYMRQEDLAEKTNLSVTYVGMIERGERMPKLDTFVEIANVLGVTADQLLYDVLSNGYKIKSTIISDSLEKIADDDRKRIFEVMETMIKSSKRK